MSWCLVWQKPKKLGGCVICEGPGPLLLRFELYMFRRHWALGVLSAHLDHLEAIGKINPD